MSYKASIGLYNIESEKGFSNDQEVITFVQERYPFISKEDIKKIAKKLINKDGYKPDNIVEKVGESGKSFAKVDNGGTKKSKS